jgi:regulator of replication initiation timing
MEWVGIAGFIAIGALLGGLIVFVRLSSKIAKAYEIMRDQDSRILCLADENRYMTTENRRLRRALMDTTSVTNKEPN